MNTVLKGQIRSNVPYFYYSITTKGTLVLKSKKGNEITVDTGFIGTVALPEKVLKKMGLKPIGTGVFTLADGSTVSLPIYWGQIKIKNKDFQTWFIPCDYLLGMELLELAGDCLSLDFRQQTVRLESRGIA